MKNKDQNQREQVTIPARHNFFLLFFFLLIFAIQAFWHAKDKSATYDEGGHLATSVLLWKTDHSDYDIGHPPLTRYLWGLSLLGVQLSTPDRPLPLNDRGLPIFRQSITPLFIYASDLLYKNRIPAEKILFFPRIVNILCGVFLGILIFLWASKLYGPRGGLLSLVIFAFCPNLIAHSSLVTTDLGGTVSAVAFLFSFQLLLEKNSAQRIFWTTNCLGLALLAKFSNVVLAPLFVALYVGFSIQNKCGWGQMLKTVFLVSLGAWAIVCAGYKFEDVFVRHLIPQQDADFLNWNGRLLNFYNFLPFPDSYLRGLFSVLVHDKRGHGAFLNGDYSSTGWWYYFPAAFLLKTPTSVLCLLFLWIFLALKKRLRFFKGEFIIISTCAIVIFSAMRAHLNIGLRHLLLVYPLLYILLGGLGQFLFAKSKTKIFSGILCVLLLAETLSVAPHYLAFFNRLAGGPEAGFRYLSDSNIDWGQDLKNLVSFLKKEGNPEILLSYFGTAVPQYYGMRYQSLPNAGFLPTSTHLNSPKPAKEFLAVSVTNLQGTYFVKRDLYGWLANKKPIAKIGYSIYVYDITNDLESQKKLLEIYQLTGDLDKFTRQVSRVKKMS